MNRDPIRLLAIMIVLGFVLGIFLVPPLVTGAQKLILYSRFPYPLPECPTTKVEAEDLFGNEANLWSIGDRGWQIGPLEEKVIVTRPPLFVAVLTYLSGREAIFGVTSIDIDLNLDPGETLELICPSNLH